MKIVAIDAGRRGSAISKSVDVAARAAAASGAEVVRIHLNDLDIRRCHGCGICQLGGGCKIADDLGPLADEIFSAQGVIYGAPEYLFRADERTAIIVERLAEYLEGANRTLADHAAKRAVFITASDLPVSISTFFGYRIGPMRKLRDALRTGGFKTIGSLVMNGALISGLRLQRDQADRARSLGRVLVGRV